MARSNWVKSRISRASKKSHLTRLPGTLRRTGRKLPPADPPSTSANQHGHVAEVGRAAILAEGQRAAQFQDARRDPFRLDSRGVLIRLPERRGDLYTRASLSEADRGRHSVRAIRRRRTHSQPPPAPSAECPPAAKVVEQLYVMFAGCPDAIAMAPKHAGVAWRKPKIDWFDVADRIEIAAPAQQIKQPRLLAVGVLVFVHQIWRNCDCTRSRIPG